MTFYKIYKLAQQFVLKYDLIKTSQQLNLPFPEFNESVSEVTDTGSEVKYEDGDFNYFEKVTEENLKYDFSEWLEGALDVRLVDLFKFFNKLGIKYSTCGNPIWGITFKYKNQLYVLELENKLDSIDAIIKSEETVSYPYKAQDFIDRADPDDYIDMDSSDNFWDNPSTLYHATAMENKKAILTKGIVSSSKTRGLTNKSVGAAVFTSTNPDAIDSYGDLIIKIDTQKMKSDKYMPEVGIEPDVEYADKINALAHVIGLEDYYYEPEQGMDMDTYILYGDIPSKYISIYNGD